MTKLAELFTLKGAALTGELRDLLRANKIVPDRSILEKEADTLIAPFIAQVPSEIVASSQRMSEFYRLFYILEVDIRQFICDVLDDGTDDWWIRTIPQPVRDNATKTRNREENEGLAPRSENLIDYTSFGELGQIISDNWEVFQGLFGGASRSRVQRVVARLNFARNPIAHCGTLDEDEIVRLKLSIRDWYKLLS